ncbi:unnamed protein product [Urochloa decumbens]|uniref:F-box protein n=1 Tax=Urochloa decumbens TaxID=240449 RepID=A0ABC8Y1N6_9POAL
MLTEAKEPLPLSLAGILIKFHGGFDFYITELFSRPSTGSPSTSIITGKHDYLPQDEGTPYGERQHSWSTVRDHCNGLLLLDGYVLNPVTRRLDPLPPSPSLPEKMHCSPCECLAYDPTVSPYYEVISFPRFRSYRKQSELDPAIEQSEWPPAQWMLQVFSSRTGSWEERAFVREGEAVGTIADRRLFIGTQCNSVYLGGVLYIHYCESDFILRGFTFTGYPCQVIDINYHYDNGEAVVIEESEWSSEEEYEWSSEEDNVEALVEDGIECSILEANKANNMEAFIEEESEWSSEEDDDVEAPVEDECSLLESNKSNNMEALVEEDFEWNSEASVDEKVEWNSDNEDSRAKPYNKYIGILGFHPYREIVFLSESIKSGLAYHLNGSKIDDLGNMYPKRYDEQLLNEMFIESSFPYTPCWL